MGREPGRLGELSEPSASLTRSEGETGKVSRKVAASHSGGGEAWLLGSP